jgi:hypothetical protein
VMTLYSSDGTSASTIGPGTQAVTVHGFDGTLQTVDDTNANILWHDDAVTYQLLVAGARAADRAFVLDVASRVARTGPTSADVALQPVPDGFAVRYSGTEDRLTPTGGWKLEYKADDGRVLELGVTSGGLTAEQLAAVHDYEPITVSGHSAYAGVGGPDAYATVDPTNQTLVIDLADGMRLALVSFGLRPEELLATAADLRVVDNATWRTVVHGADPYFSTTTIAVDAPR